MGISWDFNGDINILKINISINTYIYIFISYIYI